MPNTHSTRRTASLRLRAVGSCLIAANYMTENQQSLGELLRAAVRVAIASRSLRWLLRLPVTVP